jgi:hypothetical protein
MAAKELVNPAEFAQGLSTEMRTFDSDERRLFEEVRRELYRYTPSPFDRETCNHLAEKIVLLCRDHIQRTVEDALA